MPLNISTVNWDIPESNFVWIWAMIQKDIWNGDDTFFLQHVFVIFVWCLALRGSFSSWKMLTDCTKNSQHCSLHGVQKFISVSGQLFFYVLLNLGWKSCSKKISVFSRCSTKLYFLTNVFTTPNSKQAKRMDSLSNSLEQKNAIWKRYDPHVYMSVCSLDVTTLTYLYQFNC